MITAAIAPHTYGMGDIQAANSAQLVRKTTITAIPLSSRSPRCSLMASAHPAWSVAVLAHGSCDPTSVESFVGDRDAFEVA